MTNKFNQYVRNYLIINIIALGIILVFSIVIIYKFAYIMENHINLPLE